MSNAAQDPAAGVDKRYSRQLRKGCDVLGGEQAHLVKCVVMVSRQYRLHIEVRITAVVDEPCGVALMLGIQNMLHFPVTARSV